ncbi:MAG: DUF1573 domain-containing protein [Chitinophagaceae bacterium]|nr:DUF1573 domain-containing protein [Chitinophagaceae bacterium]MBK9957321.1 DUF1573 domain-containing protein [Chitinophagaceae bacterium]
MKINFILLFLVLLLASCKNSRISRLPELRLSSEVINLGTVKALDTIKKYFLVYNTGSDTLFIKKVGVSCGCTNGYSNKKFILPNDSATIFFTYSPANDIDSIQKSLIVENNSIEPFKLVYIKAFVKR